ncbi:MAG: hypothetical protein HY608_08580 [Planctomycetes bacterium]|nr:hypothetical protein [Planctomycetota bacterium]
MDRVRGDDGGGVHRERRGIEDADLSIIMFALLVLLAVLALHSHRYAAGPNALETRLPPGTLATRAFFNQFPPEMHADLERDLGMR